MKKKILKWSVRILISLLALVLIAVGVFILRDRILYSDFYGVAERGMEIPGLWDGFVQQGFDWCEERGVYLACGYDKSGGPSRIYVISGEEQTRVDLKRADGSNYTEHTGGIEAYGPYVYITGTYGCDLFFIDDVFDGDGVATMVGEVKTCNDPAYCTIRGNMLYVGSYYDKGAYETPMEQHMVTPTGEQNTAIMSAYTLNPETGKPYREIPEFILSTTSQIQGMTFISDNIMVLSASYGLHDSLLHFYDLRAVSMSDRTFSVNGVDVPVAFLDSTSLIETVEAPPMSEEIVWKDDRLWIMNESASMKYLFGKLTFATHVYGIPLPASVVERMN